MYWEKDSEIKAKNSVIGTFPFSGNKNEVASKFSAPGVTLLSITLEKYPKDNPFSQSQAVLPFNDITKLGDVGVLSGMKVNTFSTDTGKIVSYVVSPEFVKTNELKAIYVIMNYEDEILYSSDNKIIDKKRAEWYRGESSIKSEKPFYFVALLKSSKDEKSVSEKKSDDGKSCGLFGMELPFIIFLGYLFPKFRRATNKV